MIPLTTKMVPNKKTTSWKYFFNVLYNLAVQVKNNEWHQWLLTFNSKLAQKDEFQPWFFYRSRPEQAQDDREPPIEEEDERLVMAEEEAEEDGGGDYVEWVWKRERYVMFFLSHLLYFFPVFAKSLLKSVFKFVRNFQYYSWCVVYASKELPAACKFIYC